MKLTAKIREIFNNYHEIKRRLNETSDEDDVRKLNEELALINDEMIRYSILLADHVDETLSPDEYQTAALQTVTYNEKFTPSERIMYATLGLVGEAGEVANKVKKFYRDGLKKAVVAQDLMFELGDVMWYTAVLAQEFELPLEVIMAANVAKLKKRHVSGTLHGSGDNR
jgi:NTP pyrophosphatase (non-canonical NTP hydrolase)